MSTLDAATAEGLVHRIAAGESRAEGELVECCGRTLRFLCRRFARDEADAEDLYQETLILALEKIRRHEVREPSRLAGFLRALAKNLSIQRYRRSAYALEKPSDTPPDRADESLPDPLGSLLDDERKALTLRLLGTLRVPRDREVLFRYYIAEEGSETICRDLNIDADHFYRILHRARMRYRRLWDERAGTG